MIRNKSQLKIKNGATGKLLKTYDEKLKIVILTGNDGFLGKGAYGKCFLGILKNQQTQKQNNSDFQQQFNEDQIKKILASPSKHPVVVVKQIKKNKKKINQEEQYKKEIFNLSLATKISGYERNIVKCYPYILTSEQHFYMVMEYCEGKSLDLLINKRLNSNLWFGFFQFLKIFADIVNGYYPLNKEFIMHQDIKPENIFIKGKNFKIGDFGLSFLVKDNKIFRRGGSQSYNGIQKYNKDQTKPSNKSDMYAIGIILHKLLYGVHPYYQKREWQEYKLKQMQRILVERHESAERIKISGQEEYQMFIKFYLSRLMKKRKPYIRKPQLKYELQTVYGEIIQSLYTKLIPQLISKLIAKDINDRPSYTQVLLFLADNKVSEILKEAEYIAKCGQKSIMFFQDLQDESINHINLSIAFTQMGKKVFFQDQSQIQQNRIIIAPDLLRTSSFNKQRKLVLSKKYPRLFQCKQKIEEINALTRMLMEVHQQLSEFDLKQFFKILNENQQKKQYSPNLSFIMQGGLDQNEMIFYEDKKMQVQFVVQKYLLSLLSCILNYCREWLKQLSQLQLQLFYRQNVDMMVQTLEKNRQYLKDELFLRQSDYNDYDKSVRDLDRVIINDFLDNITLDRSNLLFVYYCLTIIKIKDILSQRKKQFRPYKIDKNNKNNLIQQQEQKQLKNKKHQLEDIRQQKNHISQILYKTKQIPDAFLKQVEEIIIKQLKYKNITYGVNY